MTDDPALTAGGDGGTNSIAAMGGPPAPVIVSDPRHGRLGTSTVTVVESIYHRRLDREPVATEEGFERLLMTNEQAYAREVPVGQAWQPLDLGWLGNAVGMLVLRNEEGRRLRVQPTPEEQAVIAGRVVEVCCLPPEPTEAEARKRTMLDRRVQNVEPWPQWFVPPGESMRGLPADASRIVLRCRGDRASCVVFLVPA